VLNIFNLHNSFGPISYSISYGPYQLFEIVKAFKELGDILKTFYGPLKALISHNFMCDQREFTTFRYRYRPYGQEKSSLRDHMSGCFLIVSLKSIKIFNLVNWQGPINFFCFIFNFIFWPFRWNRIKTIERSFLKPPLPPYLWAYNYNSNINHCGKTS